MSTPLPLGLTSCSNADAATAQRKSKNFRHSLECQLFFQHVEVELLGLLDIPGLIVVLQKYILQQQQQQQRLKNMKS